MTAADVRGGDAPWWVVLVIAAVIIAGWSIALVVAWRRGARRGRLAAESRQRGVESRRRGMESRRRPGE